MKSTQTKITRKKKSHVMKLDEKYFLQILLGLKNIEARVNDEKRQKVEDGDDITFVNTANPEQTIETEVDKKKLANNFEQALREAKLKNILPGVKTYEEGVEVYHSIPGYQEKAKKYGVVLFYLKLK